MRKSIRAMLLWLLLGVLTVAWIASAWLVYNDAHREIDSLLDAQLRQSAELLVLTAGAVARREESPHDEAEDEDDELDRFRTGVAFQVQDASGALLQRSVNAPAVPFSEARQGFESVRRGDQEWRVYTMRHGSDGRLVQVAADHFARERIARDIALGALAPMLLVLPVLGLGMGWVVRRSLQPLDALGQEIAHRGVDDLSPLATRSMPAELAPLVHRLDQLFSRIRTSVDSERRFTSHAAHELRTPVAALRAQAEVAGSTDDPAVRKAALERCIQACDRMTRLVSQLLVLARADELTALTGVRPCQLDEIARRALAGVAPTLAPGRVELELEAPEACHMHGDPGLLDIMLRNLLDNAVRHARTSLRVRLRANPDTIVCTVSDDGPGVPSDALHQLGNRFFRAADASGPGSGLGLSIVHRIAALHRGTVSYANREPAGTGFEATLVLPR